MRVIALALVAMTPLVLRPGASDIVSDHLGAATETVRFMKGDSEIGRFRYEWSLVSNDGLLLVTTGAVRAKPFIDSSLVKRHGLAPVWEVSQLGTQVKRWTYKGDVFNFQELDDLLRSLPLREGYERILPLFSEGDDSLEMDTVRVVSRDPAGRWTLRFADPAIVATYEIDERTRRIVRHEHVSRRSGATLRFVPE